MAAPPSIDRILSTLNAADIGTIDKIAEKMGLVASDLRALGHEGLATSADAALQALTRADVTEYKRLRAFIQSKAGHLR
jgi:hypothetical protein